MKNVLKCRKMDREVYESRKISKFRMIKEW